MKQEFKSVVMAAAERKAEQLELEFSFEGYQVVRRELFAHINDPAVTIRRDSVTFNNACIRGLEDAVYILILINPHIHRLLIQRCDENEKNALRWCIPREEGRESRQIKSRDFSDQLYKLLDWDKRNRYKILGYRIKYQGEAMFIFDLMETEVFDDTTRKDPSFEKELEELNKNVPQKGQKKAFDADKVTSTFGVPLEENQKALQLEKIEDYVDSDLAAGKEMSYLNLFTKNPRAGQNAIEKWNADYNHISKYKLHSAKRVVIPGFFKL